MPGTGTHKHSQIHNRNDPNAIKTQQLTRAVELQRQSRQIWNNTNDKYGPNWVDRRSEAGEVRTEARGDCD